MTKGKRGGLRSAAGWALSLVICGVLSTSSIVGAQVSDEASLRSLIDRFFAAYQKEDLEAIIGLWSQRSSDLPFARQTLQQTFAENDKINLTSLALVRITFQGEKAAVRLTVDVGAVDAKTGNPSTGPVKQNSTFHFVREGGNWKVWQLLPTEEDIGAALVAADSDQKLQLLLQAEKEFITVELQRALISKGSQAISQGKYQEAISVNKIAQTVAEGLGDKKGIALAARGSGLASYLRADYKKAMNYFSISLKVSEEVVDKVGVSRALNSIGMIHQVQGNSREALDHYERSLKLTQETGDKSDGARALFSLGSLYQSQSNLALASEYYVKSLSFAEEVGDKALISRAVIGTGIVDAMRGTFPRALERFQKALKLAEDAGDFDLSVRALNNIGEVYRLQGDYKQAIDYLSKSLGLSERSGSKQSIARPLNNLGLIHQSRGSYAEALEFFIRSLRLAEEIDDKGIISTALINIGNVYMSQGNYTASFRYLQKSLKLAEAGNNRLLVGMTLGNIGNIYHLEGNYRQALDYFQKSLKIAEEIGDKAGIGNALNNIGSTYYVQENFPEALNYYQRSLKLKEEIGDKGGQANTLNNIGTIHGMQQAYPVALEYFQKSLRLSEELNDDPLIAAMLMNIAEVQRLQGRFGEAVELAKRAAEIARKSDAPDNMWTVLTILGRAEYGLGHTDQARKGLVDAISTIEGQRTQLLGGEETQQQFFEDKLAPYYAMVDLLVDQNDLLEAFTFAERSKSRALLDVLEGGRVNITKSMTQQELEEERNLSLQLVSLNNLLSREKLRTQPDQPRLDHLESELQAARLDHERFQVNLYSRHPELKVLRGQIQPITLEQTQKLIPDAGTALLEFVVTDDKTYLFVLTRRPSSAGATNGAVPGSPTDLKVYTVRIKRTALAERIQRLRTRFANKDFIYQNEAIELYELLLGQARPQLHGKTSLIVVPDNVLWEVPFQALQSARNRFLIQDSAVSYAPSLSVLLRMTTSQSRAHVGAPTLLAFGNPAIAKEAADVGTSNLTDDRLDPLPEAERQVKALAKLYGPAHSKVYVGAEAREDRVKTEAANYRILHFAAHAILNDKNPMYSHLVLSQIQGSATEDGLLEAREIMNLDLKADIVVLAACETARGRIRNGEGIIGLTWASFVAGAPATVVTQWKVDSSGSTELMIEFHRQLKLQQPKAEALRQAALKLLRTNAYRHPFYWAGFVIAGSGR